MRTIQRHKNSELGLKNGFSLLELMLAIALGSFMMLSATMLFVSLKSFYETQMNLMDVEQRAETAFTMLRDIVNHSCKLQAFETIDSPNWLSKVAKNSEALVLTACQSGLETAIFLAKPNYQGAKISLYLQEKNNKRVEIVNAVNAMQFSFAQICPNKTAVCQLLNLKQVKNWQQIGGLQITLNFADINSKEKLKSWIAFIRLNKEAIVNATKR